MNLLGRVVHPPNTEGFTTRETHPKEKYIAVDDSGFLQQSPETSGWDTAEGVFKVANYVWDTDLLAWVRATSGGSGGATSASTHKKKLVDQASASTIYLGEADAGSASSSPVWRIKRVTISGSLVATEWAAVGASTQVWDNRASLSYS